MLNENAKAWVAALRSGRFKQGYHHLTINTQDGMKNCCLGVACELFIETHPDGSLVRRGPYGPEGILDYEDKRTYIINHTNLPEQVRKWLGLRTEEGAAFPYSRRFTTLADMNDSGRTFEEIASFIESDPSGLFE